MEEIGRRIRQYRTLRKLTMRQLAEASEVSPSLISQLENNRQSASLATLTRLAWALGVSLADLVSDRETPSGSRVMRAKDRPEIRWGTQSSKRLIVERPFEQVEAYEMVLMPGEVLTDVTYGDSFVVMFVISGQIELTVGPQADVLEQGDSVTFWSSHVHGFRTIGDEPGRALLSLTPPAVKKIAET